MAWIPVDSGGTTIWGNDATGEWWQPGSGPKPASMIQQEEAAKGPSLDWAGIGQARPGDFTSSNDGEYFHTAQGQNGETFYSPKKAPAGATFSSTIRDLLSRDPSGRGIAQIAQSGYFKQFADYDPNLEGQLVAAGQATSNAGPEGMLKGAYIHGGNVLDDWKNHPVAGIVGPVGGSLFGGESSNVWGQPSDATYQEQGSRGVDVQTSHTLNDFGKAVGLMAAGAGVSNAMGTAGGATPSGTQGGSQYTQLAEGGNTMTDVPLTGGPSMPSAVPEVDPTFGNTLTQSSPYAFEDLSHFPQPSGVINSNFTPTSAPTNPQTGAMQTAAGVGGGTALSRLLDGSATTADYLSLGGTGLATGLGIYGANQQANSYADLANKYMSFGAPSRARYEASFAPGFNMNMDPGYTDALNQSSKATLHGLSTQGNPADSPNAWSKTLSDLYEKTAYPALQNYRSTNANAGGIASLQAAAPGASSNAINAQGGIYNAIGAGAADIFNPPKSLAQILKEARVYG